MRNAATFACILFALLGVGAMLAALVSWGPWAFGGALVFTVLALQVGVWISRGKP